MSSREIEFTEEMKAMVGAFFDNATPEQLQQLLTESDYTYYRNLKVPVLDQQPRSQTIHRDRVLVPFFPSTMAFLEIISFSDLSCADNQGELALAA
jgi:hypothetical protein